MRALILILIISFTNSLWAGDANKVNLVPAYNFQDLGFDTSTTEANPKLQMQLEKRSYKLQAHQISGLVTAGLMLATLLTAEEARSNDIHQVLGGLTGLAYWYTFYLSATAPNPTHAETQGMNIKIHKAMRWVHGPLMILTPIAGIMASRNIRNHRDQSGLAAHKAALGGLTAASYFIGIGVMAFEF